MHRVVLMLSSNGSCGARWRGPLAGRPAPQPARPPRRGLLSLDGRAEGDLRVRRGDAHDRRLEAINSPFGDNGRNFGGGPAGGVSGIDDDETTGARHRIEDGIRVQRHHGARIDHFDRDAFGFKFRRSLHGHMHASRNGVNAARERRGEGLTEPGLRGGWSTATSTGGADRGPWGDAVWVECADGKLRRTQPGLGLLAHGISERVARLRTLGNAIVPQVAAQILAAIIASEARP